MLSDVVCDVVRDVVCVCVKQKLSLTNVKVGPQCESLTNVKILLVLLALTC